MRVHGRALLAIAMLASGSASAAESMSPVKLVTLGVSTVKIDSIGLTGLGPYVVALEKGTAPTNVILRRFGGAGRKIGKDIPVVDLTGPRSDAQIAMEANGDFVVTWVNGEGALPGAGIYARKFTAAGVPKGDPILVTDQGNKPKIAAAPGGDFVVGWFRTVGDGSPTFVRPYTADGVPKTSEIAVQSTKIARTAFDVAMRADGDFAVAFEGFPPPNADTGQGIYLRQFRANGTPKGTTGESLVFKDDFAETHTPSIALTETGEFIVVWSRDPYGVGEPAEIQGRCYRAGGSPKTDMFVLNDYHYGPRVAPDAAAAGGENFTVAWQASGQAPSKASIVAKRIFVSTCQQNLGEFIVTPVTGYDQITPMVSVRNTGDTMIGWSAPGNTSKARIFAGSTGGKPTVSFETSTEDIFENGITKIFVRLSAPQAEPLTFDVNVGGTANDVSDVGATQDFTITGPGIVNLGTSSYRWTIPAGATRAGLNLKALEDGEDDPGEYVLMKLNLANTPTAALGPSIIHATGILP